MDNERKTLPKQAFDSEYMTEFLREVRFLTERGIQYTFVKKTRDYGVSQYKYKKSPALFAALVEFYAVIEAEKTVREANREKKKKDNFIPKDKFPATDKPQDTVISPEQIQKAQEVLERAVQQGVIQKEVTETEDVTVTSEKDDTV